MKYLMGCVLIYVLSASYFPEIREFFGEINHIGNGSPGEQWVGLLAFSIIAFTAAGLIRSFFQDFNNGES